MSYKIGKLLIDNFKHVDLVSLDFHNKDLIVFDGPNGFGKTTLFDAIEIIISGKISRVINTTDGRHGYNELLFSNTDERDTVIKIEFYNDYDSFTVVRRFDHTTPLNAIDRRPDNWNVFKVHILEKFDDPLTSQNLSNSREIYSKLGMHDFSRYFNLFYYVQQEENTYFLRKSGKERMREIAQLFDTSREENELSKYISMKRELDTENRKINGDNGSIAEKTRTLNILKEGINDIKEDVAEIEYSRLIKEGYIKEWDKEDVTPLKRTKDLYLSDLRQLYDFKDNFKEFLKTQKNKEILKYHDNKKLLKDTIVSYNYLIEYNEIKDLKEKQYKLENLKGLLIKENLQTNLDSFPYNDLKNLVGVQFDFDAISEKIKSLVIYKNSASDLSVILQELNSTRDVLLEKFNKIKEKEIQIEDSNCPLCGYDWASYDHLIKSINIKRKNLQKNYDDFSEKYESIVSSLYDEHLTSIIQWIENFLKTTRKQIDEDFYKQLTKSIRNKASIQRFDSWCFENEINFKYLVNKKRKFVSDLDDKVAIFERLLLSKKETIKSGYEEYEDKIIGFESLYDDLFNNDKLKVESLSLHAIKKKINYINYHYYHNNTKSILDLNEEIENLKERSIIVLSSLEKLKNIIKIYKQRINTHYQHILRDIEIPFYIYSGKVLQDYQRGLGLFIKESETDGAKNIKFVSNAKFGHDALNYLSSGQLSGLVIAFTFALNKIYGNKVLDILLIDDPVQTMDDINMASFTELLRNEFRDKQIFLSTHEEDTSRYLRYKFSKYNLETLRFNVKERLYTDS